MDQVLETFKNGECRDVIFNRKLRSDCLYLNFGFRCFQKRAVLPSSSSSFSPLFYLKVRLGGE